MPEYFFIVIHGFLVFKYFQIIRITQNDLKALPLTKPLGLFFILCLSLHLILACSLILQAYELFKASMWAALFSVVLFNFVLVLSMLFTLYVYSEGKQIEKSGASNWSLSAADKLAQLFQKHRFQFLLGLIFCLLFVATIANDARPIGDWNPLRLFKLTGLIFDALFLIWLALILNGWTAKSHWSIKIPDKINNLMIIAIVAVMNLTYLTAGYLIPETFISNLKLEAIQANPWWHSVPILISCISIFFLSWHVFRINKLDKYVEELAHVILILVSLWLINYLFTEKHSFESFSFFIVLLITFISGVMLYKSTIKLSRRMWTPEEAKLKMIHQKLPHLLSSTTNSNQAITVTEQLLSDIFKANISINKPTPRLNAPEEPSQNIVIPGSPHMYMELGYMSGWKPWFSESIKWAIYAGQYLQAHLQVISHSELKHQTSLKVQKISALAYKSEAQALRAQMRPHFLFNTLNTVKYLVVEEPEEAERTIEQLALLLRASITLSENDLVTLGAEMDLVENYLNIEKSAMVDGQYLAPNYHPSAIKYSYPRFVCSHWLKIQ